MVILTIDMEKIKHSTITPEGSKIAIEKPASLATVRVEATELESGQKLGTAVIDARDKADGDIFVATMGFNGSVEDFEIQKHAAMAEQLNSELILVDTPGFGELSNGLTSEQVKDMLTGHYDKAAEAVLEAAIKAGGLNAKQEINLLGYSQGASLIASMAKILNEQHDRFKNLQIAGIHMIEPVGTHRQFSPWLSVKMGTENKLNDGYFEENEELLDENGQPWAVLSSDRRVKGDPDAEARFKEWTKRQMPGLLIGGMALGGGHIPRDLLSALKGSEDTTRLNEAVITSTLAGESHMNFPKDVEKMMVEVSKAQKELGRAAILQRPEDGHAFVLSHQRSASAARHIRHNS